MEYTLFSVMLCHAWPFSVMDGVGHWGCNSPGDCKFIVLHFYICPGVLQCVAKKQCSHHILKITTVDIQPDGEYIFRNNSVVDKRQKSLRLHLLSGAVAAATCSTSIRVAGAGSARPGGQAWILGSGLFRRGAPPALPAATGAGSLSGGGRPAPSRRFRWGGRLRGMGGTSTLRDPLMATSVSPRSGRPWQPSSWPRRRRRCWCRFRRSSAVSKPQPASRGRLGSASARPGRRP